MEVSIKFWSTSFISQPEKANTDSGPVGLSHQTAYIVISLCYGDNMEYVQAALKPYCDDSYVFEMTAETIMPYLFSIKGCVSSHYIN